MKKLIVFPAIILMSFCLPNSKDAYVLYDSKGKKTDYTQMLTEAKKSDIILFGELHDNPICHWLQKELTEDLYTKTNWFWVLKCLRLTIKLPSMNIWPDV